MKTHNLIIYHCLNCGAVMHCEPEEDSPRCCQRPMTRAAAETVSNGGGEAPTNARPTTLDEDRTLLDQKAR